MYRCDMDGHEDLFFPLRSDNQGRILAGVRPETGEQMQPALTVKVSVQVKSSAWVKINVSERSSNQPRVCGTIIPPRKALPFL